MKLSVFSAGQFFARLGGLALGLLWPALACAGGLPVVPLDLALDTPGRAWTTSNTAPWFGQNFDSHDGADVARSGGTQQGEESWLETTVTGPAWIRGWVKKDGGSLEIQFDGSKVWQASTNEWVSFQLQMPSGTHRVRWVQATQTRGDAAALDQFVVIPISETSLSAAMDYGNDQTVWSAPESLALGCVDANEVGAVGGDFVSVRANSLGGKPYFFLDIDGPVRIRFRWRVLGSGDLVVNGHSLTAAQNGSWQQSSLDLPSGARSISWVADSEAGELRLDDLQVEQLPSLPVALGTPQWTWSGPEWTTRNLATAAGGSVASSRIMNGGEGARSLSTRITGPVEVTVISSAIKHDLTTRAVSVSLDKGLSGQTQPLPEGWFLTTILVPEGPHQLIIKAERAAGEASVECLVDEVQLRSLPAISVSQALESPAAWGGSVTGAPEQAWRPVSGLSDAAGGTAMICGPLTNGSGTELALNVTGPGELIFSVRSEDPAYYENRFKVWLDGAVVMAPGVSGEWEHHKFMVPSGKHLVKFTARAQQEMTAPVLNFWLDAVKFLPEDAGLAGIAAATGMTNGVWSRSADASGRGWRSHSGLPGLPSQDAAVCMGPIAAEAPATMSATITGPGVLAFDWHRTESAVLWDSSLTCEVDGVTQLDFDIWWGFPQPLHSRRLVFPEGTRTITWKLVRNGTSLEPQDAILAWVDNVTFTPAIANGTLADALDMTGNITTDATWPLRRVSLAESPVTTSGGPADDDAAYVEVPPNETTWIEIPVTETGRTGCWIRTESGNFEQLALEIDGVRYEQTPVGVFLGAWERLEFPFTEGSHVVKILLRPMDRWELLPLDQTEKLWITGVGRFPEVTLGEALDATGLTWTVGSPVGGPFPMAWIAYPAGDGLSYDAAATLGTAPLSTSVTGPAVVKFHWEAQYTHWDDWFGAVDERFFVDGMLRGRLTEDLESRDEEIFVGPGTHTLTWQRTAQGMSRRLLLNHVQVQPVDTSSLTTELNVPNSVVGVSGNQTWTVDSSDSHDGIASLRATGAVGQNARLEMEVDGPGELTYWWRGDLGQQDIFWATVTATAQLLPFEADGGYNFNSSVMRFAGDALVQYQDFPWEQRRLQIGFGHYRMTWSLAQESGPAHQLWLDEVHFTPLVMSNGNAALTDALDSFGLTWTSSPGWQRVAGSLESSHTDDVLAGAVINPTDAAQWVETTITGPTRLHFWYGTTEILPADQGGGLIAPDVLVDDVRVSAGIRSQTPYATVTIPAGTHTVRLVFSPDSTISYRPLLDFVMVGTTLEEALDTTGLTWTGNWPAWTSAAEAGRDDFAGLADDPYVYLQTAAAGSAVQFDVFIPSPPHNHSQTPSVLQFKLDGITRWDSFGLAPGWHTIQVPMTGDTQLMRWEFNWGLLGYDQHFMLDHVAVTPGTSDAISLAEALDTPGRTWAGTWVPSRNSLGSVHDDAAVASTASSAALSTTVTGPAWVQFDYQNGNQIFRFEDATRVVTFPQLSYLEPPVWKQSSPYLLEAGSHSLIWRTQATTITPNRMATLDAVKIEPVAEVPLATALDTAATWTATAGAGKLLGVPIPGAVGGSAAVASMNSSNSAPGFLESSVTGPVMLEYRWRPLENGATTRSVHRAWVDGIEQLTQFGLGDGWQVTAWSIPTGVHLVKFQAYAYGEYNTAVGQTLSSVIIDHVTLTPSPSLTDALDCGALNVTTTGYVVPWQYADGRHEVQIGGQGNVDSVMELTVTGPGEVSFDITPTQISQSSYQLWVDGMPVESGATAFVNKLEKCSIAFATGTHHVRWLCPPGAVAILRTVCWQPGVPAWAQWLGGLDGGISAWVTASSTPGWTPVAAAGPGGAEALQSSPTTISVSLQPVMNQPGTLCYWRNESNQARADWRFFQEFVGVAGTAPAWVLNATGFVQVAGVSFTPAAIVPLAEALDTPGQIWDTSNPQAWHGLTGASVEGRSAVFASGPTIPSFLQTTFNGPGWLSYSWRAGQSTSIPLFTINDNQESMQGLANGDWQTFNLWLEAGSQQLKWTIESTWPPASFWLDAVHFQAATSVSLAEALDTDTAVWTTSSGAPWVGYGNVNGAIGNDLAAIPTTAEGENWIQTTFSGSGELRFRWAFGREDTSNQDEMQCLLDGTLLAHRLGGTNSQGWEDQVFALGSGPHTLRWRYLPGYQRPGALLDQVSFTPNSVAETWGTRLGQPSLNFSGGGVEVWQNRPAGGLMTTSSLLTHGMSLVTSIAGPAWVSYDARNTNPAAQVIVNGITPPDDLLDQTPPRHRFYVPAGVHSVKWLWEKQEYQSGNDIPAISNITVTPMTALTPAEAADAPDFPLIPDAGVWLGTSYTDSHQGGNLIAIYPQSYGLATMNASVTGPGVLRFWWKQTPPIAWSIWSNVFKLNLDSLPAAQISSQGEWEEVTVVVPPGTQVLHWISPSSTDAGPVAFLDALTWHPTSQAATLALAADLNGLTSLTNQDHGWFPLEDARLAPDGTDVLAANSFSANPSLLEAECVGSGTLHFLVNNPGNSSFLLTKLNGNQLLDPVSYTGGWKEQSVFLSGPGPHHLSWLADFSYYPGKPTVLLDQISFIPASENVALAEALDQPRWIFRMGGSRLWTGVRTTVGNKGALAAVHTLRLEDNQPWVETTITGPGLLTYEYTGELGLTVDGTFIIQNGNGSVNIANGPHVVRWFSNNRFDTADRSFTLDNLQWYPDTWAGWVDYRFAGTGASLAQQEPYADPDGDGRCNALEAVLGSDPLASDPPAVEIVRPLLSAETAEPQFTVAERYPEGLFPSLEYSNNLTSPWTLFAAAGSGHIWNYPLFSSRIPDKPGQFLVRPENPTFSYDEPTRFWRLRVEKR